MSAGTLTEWLDALERRAEAAPDEEKVLWPRTPIDDGEMQRIIGQRVGASDLQPQDARSRPHRVARAVAAVAGGGPVRVIDIACGDGRVLLEVARRVPSATCAAVDLYVDAFASHADVRAAGIDLRRVLIQDLFATPAPERWDVAVMLNTYRGWENADLRSDEQDLPRLADAWFDASARHVLLTMRTDQIPAWQARGYTALDLGRGEDASQMVLLSRQAPSRALRARAALIRARHGRPRLRGR